jgi:hypothetical protein
MPGYSAPSAAYVRQLTGISTEVEDFFETELGAVIEDLIPSAEAELAALMTEATFILTTHAARQVLRMQMYVAYKVAEMLYGRFGGIVGQDAQNEIMIRPEQMTEARLYFGRRARQMHLLILAGEYLTRAKLEPVA